MFQKYCCYTKHQVIKQIWTYEIYVGDITDVSKYHNAGIWSMDLKILRFMFKNI